MIESEPKEMRPMTAETNDPIKKKKPVIYLVNLQTINGISNLNLPAVLLYELLGVFLSDDEVTGLIMYKKNYKTTTVKID